MKAWIGQVVFGFRGQVVADTRRGTVYTRPAHIAGTCRRMSCATEPLRKTVPKTKTARWQAFVVSGTYSAGVCRSGSVRVSGEGRKQWMEDIGRKGHEGGKGRIIGREGDLETQHGGSIWTCLCVRGRLGMVSRQQKKHRWAGIGNVGGSSKVFCCIECNSTFSHKDDAYPERRVAWRDAHKNAIQRRISETRAGHSVSKRAGGRADATARWLSMCSQFN